MSSACVVQADIFPVRHDNVTAMCLLGGTHLVVAHNNPDLHPIAIAKATIAVCELDTGNFVCETQAFDNANAPLFFDDCVQSLISLTDTTFAALTTMSTLSIWQLNNNALKMTREIKLPFNDCRVSRMGDQRVLVDAIHYPSVIVWDLSLQRAKRSRVCAVETFNVLPAQVMNANTFLSAQVFGSDYSLMIVKRWTVFFGSKAAATQTVVPSISSWSRLQKNRLAVGLQCVAETQIWAADTLEIVAIVSHVSFGTMRGITILSAHSFVSTNALGQMFYFDHSKGTLFVYDCGHDFCVATTGGETWNLGLHGDLSKHCAVVINRNCFLAIATNKSEKRVWRCYVNTAREHLAAFRIHRVWRQHTMHPESQWFCDIVMSRTEEWQRRDFAQYTRKRRALLRLRTNVQNMLTN